MSLRQKYVELGIPIEKIFETPHASQVIYNTKTKSLDNPYDFEEDENGNLVMTSKYSKVVSLTIRDRVTKEVIEAIHNSDGIVVTESKGNYRFGILPKHVEFEIFNNGWIKIDSNNQLKLDSKDLFHYAINGKYQGNRPVHGFDLILKLQELKGLGLNMTHYRKMDKVPQPINNEYPYG